MNVPDFIGAFLFGAAGRTCLPKWTGIKNLARSATRGLSRASSAADWRHKSNFRSASHVKHAKNHPMSKFSLYLLVLVVIIFSFNRCTKKTTTIVYKDTTIVEYKDTTFDNQTYLVFLNTGVNTISTTPIVAGELPLFDKSSYLGLDSIVFVCSGYNYSNNNGNSGSFVAELYDVTDSQIIGGSTITISDPAPQTAQYTPYYLSANILDSIPAKPIDLEILVTSSSATNNAVSGQAFLLLSR
jgi:hypothetical protein